MSPEGTTIGETLWLMLQRHLRHGGEVLLAAATQVIVVRVEGERNHLLEVRGTAEELQLITRVAELYQQLAWLVSSQTPAYELDGEAKRLISVLERKSSVCILNRAIAGTLLLCTPFGANVEAPASRRFLNTLLTFNTEQLLMMLEVHAELRTPIEPFTRSPSKSSSAIHILLSEALSWADVRRMIRQSKQTGEDFFALVEAT